MKKLLTSAIALSVVASTPAWAQNDNRHERREARQEQRQENRQQARENRQEARQDARQQQQRQAQQRQVQQQRGPTPAQRREAQEARGPGQWQGQRRDNNAQQRQMQNQRQRLQNQRERVQDQRREVRQDRRELQQDRRQLNQQRRWNNANDRRYFESRWNRRARNFDRNAYRRSFVSPRRYRIGTYYRPSGWYYRRWSPGAIFPSLFWTSNYFIDSWFSYGLMAPPWGYEWVRYGSDAVLVDVRTGEILQVRYNVFW